MNSDPYGHLPLQSFPGVIHLIETDAQAFLASLSLRRERRVGLDTESRPSFRRGEFHPISLVQVATHRHAWLYRVRPGAPFRSLKRLLEDPRVEKIVQGSTEETRELRRDLGIECRGFVDLPTAAKAAGFRELNLRALAAAALKVRISKSAQRSDWSRPDLSQQQIEYAATDAWACLAIYGKIEEKIGSPPAPEPGPERRVPREPEREGERGVRIRAAEVRDASSVVALIRLLRAGAREQSALDGETVRAYLSTPGCGVRLAELDGRVVGLLSYSIRPSLFHAAECFLIEELVVEPRTRRRGIGKAMLNAAISEAERRGCAEISVSTEPSNQAALALYRGAGLTDEAALLERHFARSRKGRR